MFPSIAPSKRNILRYIYISFVHQRPVAVCKLLTDKPTTAIAILKHVWDQEYKIPAKRVLMNKYCK